MLCSPICTSYTHTTSQTQLFHFAKYFFWELSGEHNWKNVIYLSNITLILQLSWVNPAHSGTQTPKNRRENQLLKLPTHFEYTVAAEASYTLFPLLHMLHKRQWETETTFCNYYLHNHLLFAAKIKKVWWKEKTGGSLDFDIGNRNGALPKLLIWNGWNKNETLNYFSCRTPSNLGFQSISQIINCIHYYYHQVTKLLLNTFYKKGSERFIHMQNEISSLLTNTQPSSYILAKPSNQRFLELIWSL